MPRVTRLRCPRMTKRQPVRPFLCNPFARRGSTTRTRSKHQSQRPPSAASIVDVVARGPAFRIGFDALLNIQDARAGFRTPSAPFYVVTRSAIGGLLLEDRLQNVCVQREPFL